MFASIRRYRLAAGSIDELARRVDEGFAHEISARPGFMSYEFVECDDDQVITISMFDEAQQAGASREVAQRWREQNLADVEFHVIEALHGEVMVSRAAGEMLEPAHAHDAGRFASLRRYALRTGEVRALLHTVDEVFADRVSEIHGFEAYHAVGLGHGEMLSISLFRDQAGAEDSDEQAVRFVSKGRHEFDLERTEVIGGEVRVARARAELLEPAHA